MLSENILAGCMHIRYCLTETLDDPNIAALVEILSPQERARYRRFLRARDRRDFAAAHALLRRTLSACHAVKPSHWTFVADDNGKPMLAPDTAPETGLVFNLSHTEGLVACAVRRAGVLGIDVEAAKDRIDVLDLAGQFFSPAEVADLERCAGRERHVRFIEIWTLKEAVVKALGTGLSCPLHEFTFRLDGSRIHFESSTFGPAALWRFALFAPSPQHRMAVASSLEPANEPLVAWACNGCSAEPVSAMRPLAQSS